MKSIGDTWTDDDGLELLKALAEGFERHGQGKLATVVYTLVWTRARGGGGWNVFGGKTHFDSLQNATRLDSTIALATISSEIARFATHLGWIRGITQALIYAFARGVFEIPQSVAFELWNEAFAVIRDRVPWISTHDDLEDPYVVEENDEEDLPMDIDVVLATATIAGLAHPGREQKRRSLLAIQSLMCIRPQKVAPALASALETLSDPATLTWLLRTMELADNQAAVVISDTQEALRTLIAGPHVTVRAIARRLLSDSDVPMARSCNPDPELVESIFDLSLPFEPTFDGETVGANERWIDAARVRLSEGNEILPGLWQAVRRRMDSAIEGEEQKQRLKAQISSYADENKKRTPDIFLVPLEVLEDTIQRVAGGARAARVLNGRAVADPIQLEESLAEVLLDDVQFPMRLEGTRHPRPEIPAPPGRGASLWGELQLLTVGGRDEETPLESELPENDILSGTVSVSDPESVPKIGGGPFKDWRLVATVERRLIPRPDFSDHEYDTALRIRSIEKCPTDSQAYLTFPPVADGDVRVWQSLDLLSPLNGMSAQCRPIIGLDNEVIAFRDGHLGLGVQSSLLTPTLWLLSTLGLTRSQYFVMDDDEGMALALITWRTEYETSDYYLTWPRMCGTGLVVRHDVFDRLIYVAQDDLRFRDFLQGSAILCNHS